MQTKSYARFWQRIHSLAKEKSFPLRVMFELTYRCNFYCRHCYIPLSYRKRKELKTKEIFCILDQLADIGCFYLGFTGGEPFVREDIFDILWYARKRGFEVIIYSNGSLIDKEKAQELARLRPNKVDITIPGIAKKAFEKISGVPGSRDNVFKAIELLKKKKVNLGFKTCVLKENESEIKEIQDFSAGFRALHRLDNMLSPRLDGSIEPYKYRAKKTKDMDKKIKDCQTVKLLNCCDNKDKYNQKTIKLFKCGVGVSQAAITPLGELKMCLMIDYPKYNILESSLEDCWQTLRKLVSGIKPDKNYKCDGCELHFYCKWCPGKGWLYNKSWTSCEPESYAFAKNRKIEFVTCGDTTRREQ